MALAESGVKAGRAIMSFLIPPVGIVTYFMIKDKRPKNGSAYLGIAVTSIALITFYGIRYKILQDKNENKSKSQNNKPTKPLLSNL